MQFFDRLFYHFFVLGKWDERRSDEQAAWLACRFFGLIAAINAVAALCIAAGMAGYTDMPAGLFLAVFAGAFGAVWFVYRFRRRYVAVSAAYYERHTRRSGWAMTGRFLLTMVLSISEAVAALLLAALYMSGKILPEWRF